MLCGFMQNHTGPNNMCKKTRKTKRGGTPSFNRIFYFGEPPQFQHFFGQWFSLSSLQVPNGFLLGSQYVPQDSKVLPGIFSIAPHFYRICFGKCCHPFTYIGGPNGMNIIFQNKTFYFGEPPQFHFLNDGPIKLAHCQNKKN